MELGLELDRFLQEAWELDAPTLGATLKSKGDRIVQVVETGGTRYVVKALGPSRCESITANDTGVLTFLERAGYAHSPRVIPTASGHLYARFHERFVYLMEHIEGSEPPASPGTYAALGAAAAQLHGLEGLSSPCSLNISEELKDAVRHAVDSGYSFAADLRSLVETLPDFTTLPQGPIHTDIGPHNSVMRPDGTMVLIDWDDAGVGCLAIDAGYPLICQFVDLTTGGPPFRGDLAEAFYNSYFAAAPPIDPRTLLVSALFFPIIYLQFGDPEAGWARIRWAGDHLQGT